jgi:protein tyrosine phosphatase
MRHVVYSTLLLLGFFTTPLHAMLTEPVRTFPSLPQQQREAKFQEIQNAFEERSNLFLKGKHFHPWKLKKSKEEILEEFKQIREWRNHTWYSESTGEVLVSRSDFMIAQDLLNNDLYRRPHLIAFQYNQSDSSYNSSTIVLNGYRFLAMEAPTPKLSNAFFKLLQNHRVTQLVRLTAASEEGIEKSYPYWNNKITVDAKTQRSVINLPLAGSRKTLPMLYYATNSWADHHGIEPKAFLKLINAVRKDADFDNGLIACHCTAGVGRTGTFIAGVLLIEEIDRQIAAGVKKDAIDLSIEKIVMQLSLQRLYMVAKAEQYVSLYRLVDSYIQHLN